MMQDFQTAQLDADGDGIANEKEDRTDIRDLIIGRGYIPASDKPLISSVSPAQTLSGSLSATISASGIVDVTGIERVWATLSRPDLDVGDKNNPILELPEIELTDPDGDNTWFGTYDQFDVVGTYKITIHAENKSGFYSAPSELFSNTTTVSQLIGIAGPIVVDTDGDGIPDFQDIDDDNDGVVDREDAFPLLNSSTGNLSNSEDPTFSSNANSLNLPLVEVISTDASGQTLLTLYGEVSFQLAAHCGSTVFEIAGGIEITDESILADRDITASIFDSAFGELRIPIVEVTTIDVFGEPFVTRYANVVLGVHPECSATAFRLIDAEKIY